MYVLDQLFKPVHVVDLPVLCVIGDVSSVTETIGIKVFAIGGKVTVLGPHTLMLLLYATEGFQNTEI